MTYCRLQDGNRSVHALPLSCSNDAPDDVFRRFDATSLCLSSIATTSVRFAPLRLAARFSMATLRRRACASSGGFDESVRHPFVRASLEEPVPSSRARARTPIIHSHFISSVPSSSSRRKTSKNIKNQQKNNKKKNKNHNHRACPPLRAPSPHRAGRRRLPRIEHHRTHHSYAASASTSRATARVPVRIDASVPETRHPRRRAVVDVARRSTRDDAGEGVARIVGDA